MQDAVILSTARTPIAKAFRGAFNDLKAPSMSAIAIQAAVQRAGIDPAGPDRIYVSRSLLPGERTSGAFVEANADRLSQVFINLISNARKYCRITDLRCSSVMVMWLSTSSPSFRQINGIRQC